MATTLEKIRSQLEAGLHPTHLEVLDDSGKHLGHAGAASGGGHYQVVVVATAFAGRTHLERHRLVQGLLKELFAGEVHALALQTYAPDEWPR